MWSRMPFTVLTVPCHGVWTGGRFCNYRVCSVLGIALGTKVVIFDEDGKARGLKKMLIYTIFANCALMSQRNDTQSIIDFFSTGNANICCIMPVSVAG